MAAPKQSNVLRPDKPADPSDLQYLHLSLQKVMSNTVAMNKTCRVVLSVQDLLPGYCIWKCSLVPRPRGRREMFLSSHMAWVRCYWKWITGHLQKVMNNTIAMIKTSCTCSWLLHLKSVASYPGHVGEEQPFSPPMWPGYEATKSEPLDTMHSECYSYLIHYSHLTSTGVSLIPRFQSVQEFKP